MRHRIRTLKPELFRDEKVARLQRDARFLFIGLICHADDAGRLDGKTAAIRSLVFPHDDLSTRRVDKMLDDIEQMGLIQRYQAERFDCIQILGWSKHQRIDRPNTSKIPPYFSTNGSRMDHE